MIRFRPILNISCIKPLLISINKAVCAKNISSSSKKLNCTQSSDDNSVSEASSMFKDRKYGHDLPSDSVQPFFDTLPDIPTGVFRNTAGEILGRCANKGSSYQNPEYFSYHHMTFYDMHIFLRRYRTLCPQTGRKA